MIFGKVYKNTILANTYMDSKIIRSPRFTKKQLVIQLPDYLHDKAYSVIDKMVDAFIIIKLYDDRYVLNPNSGNNVTIVNSNSLDRKKKIPPEEKYNGYKYIFEKEGKNNPKGERITYQYFRKDSSFIAIVSGGKNKETHIKLGDFHDPNSHIGKMLLAMNKLGNQFSKVQLEDMIGDRETIQNRQPLKADLDVFEHLKVITKTNQRINRSQVYSKTDLRIDMHNLDDFIDKSKPDYHS
ncbi:hypothetical protein [Candidatus Nitrosocosmicus arcticus]|nr:hypothetical protein [Candidatus Nitrosocosmicus arcticus]